MIDMENAEEIFHFLEDFSKRKPKVIPQELNEYLAYVARTGDPVYQWALVKTLFKEKLLNVITDFYETAPGIEIPSYPNVDPFNYDIMKNSLLERLDSFTAAPFTVQRICELLTYPRKQYNRVDKFMRAVEKNILVVSTREPGIQRHAEPENGEPMDPIVNGSDNNSEYNVDVEMEDMSWKENVEPQSSEARASSSEIQITVDEIEARLQPKQEAVMDTQNKVSTEYESVTPPEPVTSEDTDVKITKPTPDDVIPAVKESETINVASDLITNVELELKSEESSRDPLIIPEIKVDDAEMTEQRLSKESNVKEKEDLVSKEQDLETKVEATQVIDESSSDSITAKEESPKVISELCTSSEESSSSDNTDGNSNSPKTDLESAIEIQESTSSLSDNAVVEKIESTEAKELPAVKELEAPELESEGYSISDVKSELEVTPQAGQPAEEKTTTDTEKKEETKPEIAEVLAKSNDS